MTERIPSVVSTEWLQSRLGKPGLVVLDGSWYLPGSGRDAHAEYSAAHIPGAVFFDLDANSDRASTLPHMLPTAQAFSAAMGGLGLNNSDDLVVYDGSGINLSAPRVWWMFRTFGHDRIAVLDGGIGKWRREGRPLESGVVELPASRFTAELNPRAVRSLTAVRANISTGAEQLVDTRSRGRFIGKDPEPRRGVQSGHVPRSLNLPFTELVHPDGTILSPAELRDRIRKAGIDLGRPIVATCGSATSACALVLSLDLLCCNTDVAVYDGAWSEWGSRSDTPIETR